MTPVDIDKLKELQRLLSDGEWWQTVTRGPNPTSFTSDMTHVARQAAALIAKAERVDAMEHALERITQLRFRHAESCAAHPEYGSAGQCTCRAYEAAALARNALSPKPEDAAS